MQEPVTFTVMGQPVAKGRPRMTRGGVAYTPAKTRKYEAHARMAAQTAMMGRPAMEGALTMTIRVELPIPKSWSKKKQAAALVGIVQPQTRPDIDNYVKAALDSCNEIAFADDSQVTRITAEKVYSEQPKMVVTVKAFEDVKEAAA